MQRGKRQRRPPERFGDVVHPDDVNFSEDSDASDDPLTKKRRRNTINIVDEEEVALFAELGKPKPEPEHGHVHIFASSYQDLETEFKSLSLITKRSTIRNLLLSKTSMSDPQVDELLALDALWSQYLRNFVQCGNDKKAKSDMLYLVALMTHHRHGNAAAITKALTEVISLFLYLFAFFFFIHLVLTG